MVDGHSADGSRQVAERFGVRIFSDRGTGCADARNVGIDAARGDVVAFTDADCVADRDWLLRLTRPFVDSPEIAGVGGSLRNRRWGSMVSIFEDLNSWLTYRGFITSNVAYRRAAVVTVGGFDPDLVCGEDWDLWWRILDDGGRVVFVPRAVVEHGPVENTRMSRFVRKQFWYARMDARLYEKRLAVVRASVASSRPVAWREPGRILRRAVTDAACAFSILAFPMAPRTLAVPACVAGGILVSRGMRLARSFPREVRGSDAVPFHFTKTMARGVGTLCGLAEVAVARSRSFTRDARSASLLPPVRVGRSTHDSVSRRPPRGSRRWQELRASNARTASPHSVLRQGRDR